MDHRKFKVVPDTRTMKGKHGIMQPKPDIVQMERGRHNLQVLQELGNQLQVKAEKMRLLAKAEEGLASGDFNPYATVVVSPPNKEPRTKNDAEIKMDVKRIPISIPAAIPPTAARKKRRDKKLQPHSTNPSSVNIKHYRPGYTWNKGGRMKELRIRNLARKFLNLWKHKVFGRVTPSQARAHNARFLMKKYYRVWHGVWWELRKEWRLVVRAECHHRFVLFTKTLKAWKMFMVTQRVKNNKMALAEKHASCKFQRKCFDAWLVYVEYRKGKQEKKQQAVCAYNNVLLRKYWSHWTSQYELCLHRQHMEVVGLQFWAYRLQAQHWLIWQHKMSTKKKMVQDHYKAIRHHNTVVAKQCLQGWIKYWARRRQKKQEKVFGERVNQRMIVNRYFNRWLESFKFQQVLFDRQARMEELRETFQKRRMFLHWRHFIEQRHEENKVMEMAVYHHRQKLLMAGFSAFRLSVVQKKLKSMRNEMADQLRYKQLTSYGWNTWLLRCEDKEELVIVVQSQRARKHYRSVILRKYLYQLFNYAVWRQHRQAQYAKADAHFYMNEMPKYVFAWKIFVQLMKNIRENEENCVEFRRENLQARFFYLWTSQFELSRENRMNERMAILHCDERLGRRFFLTWKQKTADIQTEQDNEVVAADHYNEVLRHSHFKAWRLYILQLKRSQLQDIDASTHHRQRLIKTCFKAWTRFTARKRVKSQKNTKAWRHYQRALCKRMIAMWLHYVDTQKCIQQRADLLYNRQCQKLLRSAFLTWHDNVTEHISDRQAEKLSDRHNQTVILSKVFKCWHRFAAIHAYKKSETRQWVTSAQEYLNNKISKIFFDKWRRNFELHKALRIKYEKAVMHHNQMVSYKAMVQWKAFTQESIRITLLKKQSDWFLSVRLKARYFISWKHALSALEVEKEKTNLALWHWCLTLHRKVLIAWFSYTQHRKRKKALVAAAMERRRKRLLKEGIMKWLCVADDLSAMRKNFAAQQQAQSVFDVSRRVLKIGLHWKHWASKRAQNRSQESKDTPRSNFSMPLMKGDHSTHVTPRSVVSLKLVPEVDTRREVRIISAPLREPKYTVSPGRSITSVSRILPSTEIDKVKVQPRARPRRPDFLVDSLKRAGLISPYAMDKLHEDSLQSNRHIDHTESHRGDNEHSNRPVEKLNLSNLFSNQSMVSTDRTDITITKKAEVFNDIPHIGEELRQTGAESVKSFQSESQVMPPQGWINDKGQDALTCDKTPVVDTHKLKQDSVVLESTVNFRLMTPADFLGKSAGFKHQGHQRLCDIPSETCSVASQSVASTPRIVCQISDHGHPLSETRSFKVSEFNPGDMTPRSTVSCVTPREHMRSATQTIEREIVLIRNRLKQFEQKKRKLRTMQRQLKQLSNWLEEMEGKGPSSDDDDALRVKQEIDELTLDISVLKKSVDMEKVECTGLVEKVKSLMSQLTTSSN